jgi:hypothetical protein
MNGNTIRDQLNDLVVALTQLLIQTTRIANSLENIEHWVEPDEGDE